MAAVTSGQGLESLICTELTGRSGARPREETVAGEPATGY